MKDSESEFVRTKWEQLRQILLEHAVRKGDFTLRSGKKSEWYLDTRQVTLLCEGAPLVGFLMANLIFEIRKNLTPVDYVGGMELGACPIVSSVVHQGRYSGFYVRKSEKTHGVSSRIVGNIKTLSTVMILEDVLTTGDSAAEAVEVSKKFGLGVVGVIALVDRCEDGSPLTSIEGVPTRSLYTKQDFFGEKK